MGAGEILSTGQTLKQGVPALRVHVCEASHAASPVVHGTGRKQKRPTSKIFAVESIGEKGAVGDDSIIFDSCQPSFAL
jgi:hypothetical protein